MIRAPDVATAAALAAQQIADACREAVDARGRAVIAVSGGTTPWLMLERLATLDLPWVHVRVAQVDERLAPAGDARRNLTRLERILVTHGPLPFGNLLAMPADATSPGVAAADYQQRLESLAGVPVTLDLVQLGLGADGHTASLAPGDPVLQVSDRDVAVSAPYQGLRRMTLTYPALDRARRRLWLVTGAEKSTRLAELVTGASGEFPALRVSRADAIVVADEAALAAVPASPVIRAH